tara:strand:+ start:1480 stop:1854 length:375 start_codon:yes stop_codon:yes gene_type:complete
MDYVKMISFLASELAKKNEANDDDENLIKELKGKINKLSMENENLTKEYKRVDNISNLWRDEALEYRDNKVKVSDDIKYWKGHLKTSEQQVKRLNDAVLMYKKKVANLRRELGNSMNDKNNDNE